MDCSDKNMLIMATPHIYSWDRGSEGTVGDADDWIGGCIDHLMEKMAWCMSSEGGQRGALLRSQEVRPRPDGICLCICDPTLTAGKHAYTLSFGRKNVILNSGHDVLSKEC